MIPYENIHYTNNLPFSANYINVLDEPVHCHKELEILLLLRGFCSYKIYHSEYTLQPGDMIIADVEDLHRIHDASEDALMLQVHLDTKKFEEIYPNISATYFVCEGPGYHAGDDAALGSNQRMLRHQLAKLMLDASGSPNDFVLQTDNINEVLATLVRHFRGFYMEDYQYRIGRTNVSETDLDRMSRITSYLLANHEKKVTLEDVAATLHLNSYYVSHLIKKTLGIPFQHFLNGIRLEFAEKNLLFTTLSLTQVSEYSGFSSLNYFNKCFHEWYGFTPSHYRKNIPLGKRRTGPSFQQAEALDLTGRYLSPVVAIKKIVLVPSFSSFEQKIHSKTEMGAAWETERVSGWASTPNQSLRPRILLTAPDDFMGLGFLKERVSAIRPAAFLVSGRLDSPIAYGAIHTFGVPLEAYEPPTPYSTMSPSGSQAQEQPQTPSPMIRNTALALAQILADDTHSNQKGQRRYIAPPIPLFGNQNALFLPNGLATPLYTAYQLLAALTGSVLDRTPQSLQTQSGDQLTILLFNPDPRTILNVRLETKNLPEQFVLMKKQIPEENNCYEIIEALGHPDALPSEVVREIDQSHLGVPHFQMVDNAMSPVMDFMVYPQHVTLLVISPLTNRSLL